jgi:hypothetical protein
MDAPDTFMGEVSCPDTLDALGLPIKVETD